ncbi:MAG TPA: hypothetical protein ENG63_06995 [Candidatus Desulfofervidus auxilii]|uniref:Helix-turn-helix domain-containing protein n=1 Tax=Desulfofervidus auxilii TaxID=1621989 RepID=A0A7C0Y2Z8_DESA2|nr:hypothetical protein [Candidatus Desulfofervidus auxilii]
MQKPFYLKRQNIDLEAIAWLNGYENAEKMLKDLHLNKNMSLGAIARKCGLARQTLQREMIKMGIPIRKHRISWKERKEIDYVEEQLKKGKSLASILKELGFNFNWNLNLSNLLKKKGWVYLKNKKIWVKRS